MAFSRRMKDSIDNERFRKLLLVLPSKAVELLYKFYYQGLVNISKKLTGNLEASQDIVQETFVHVWERHKWLGQHHDQSIQYYLIRVVKNKSISYYKKNLKIDERNRHVNGNSMPVEHSVETSMMELELQAEIRELISRFPRRERECLLMKIDDGMTLDQIADSLKISRKAVER